MPGRLTGGGRAAGWLLGVVLLAGIAGPLGAGPLGAGPLGAGPAAAAGLCDRLEVPALLELECSVPGLAAGDERAVVAPSDGTFAALSRMTLRRLDPETDRQAWEAPAAWLERQMIVDLDAVSGAIRELGEDPDSPFGSTWMRGAFELFVSGLEGLSRLPLAACGEGPSETELACRFGVEPLGLLMKIMLVGDGDERWAFNIRTFNEQRLRHFTAIANSFDGR